TLQHPRHSSRLHRVPASPCLRVTASPCLRVTASPCLRVPASPCHRVSVSPCPRVTASPSSPRLRSRRPHQTGVSSPSNLWRSTLPAPQPKTNPSLLRDLQASPATRATLK